MSQLTRSLNELVNTLDDGIAFYDQVSDKTSNHVYSSVFARMRNLKAAIASDLKAEISMEGEQPPSDGTWLGSLRIGYAELLAHMSEHPNHVFIGQLEAQEDRVLAAFRSAVNSDASERVRELAGLYLPPVQKMHDEIRELKKISALESSRI